MNKINKIIKNYTPLNNWMRMMCLKQPRVLTGGCVVNNKYTMDCMGCNFKNSFNLSGCWD